MADAFLVYNVTCPANHPVGNAVTALNVGAGPWRVRKVTLVIPPGHAGLTGIQFWFGGNAAIPYNGGWFSGDDDKQGFEVGDAFPVGVPWSVAMINADFSNAHSWQTRWEMDYVTPSVQATDTTSVALSNVYAAGGLLDQQVTDGS